MCNSSKTLLFLFWSKVINAWWQKVYGFTATALFHLLGGQWIKQKNEVKSGRVKMLKYLRFEHFILFNYKFLSIFLPKHCRAVMRCAVQLGVPQGIHCFSDTLRERCQKNQNAYMGEGEGMSQSSRKIKAKGDEAQKIT